MSTLAKAIALAAKVHENQYDKGGVPYILHPIAVMEDVGRVTNRDRFSMTLAVLHDVLEDNEIYGQDYLRKRIEVSFGVLILQALDDLSHKKDETYNDYISRIIGSTHNEDVIIVKMADLRHNMTILRQPTLTDKDLARIMKYHKAYRRLKEHV